MPENVTRFTFPYPTETQDELRKAIVWLMSDGKRRSRREIQIALGTEKEIGARIRELKTDAFGGWPFNDARSDGRDEDGVFRHQLDVQALPMDKRRKESA